MDKRVSSEAWVDCVFHTEHLGQQNVDIQTPERR